MSSSEQNKSEQATPYKLEQARKKGMVARSQELGLVASFAACGLYLSVWGADMAARLSGRFARAFAGAGALGSNANALTHETVALALDTARAIAPLIGIAMGAASPEAPADASRKRWTPRSGSGPRSSPLSLKWGCYSRPRH